MQTIPTRLTSWLTRLLLAGLWLVPSPAEAQGSRAFYGLLGGATLSDFSDDFGGFSTDSRWGGTFGVILGIRTANWASIALEPAWIQMGGGDTRVDYLEVPLTLGGVARSPDDQMRYGAYVGIAPGFKLSCDSPDVVAACDDVKGTIWSVPIGARFLRRTGSNMFVGLDVKYAVPLGSSYDTADINQRTWAFRLMLVKGGGTR